MYDFNIISNLILYHIVTLFFDIYPFVCVMIV